MRGILHGIYRVIPYAISCGLLGFVIAYSASALNDPALGSNARLQIEVAWRADWLQAGLVEIPLDGRIALLSCQLEQLHHAPADRFIVATALDRNVPLMTADQRILDWDGKLDRLNARS